MTYPAETREECAQLVEVLAKQKPWCDHVMSRGALLLAAHIIRRGRHLTATEKLKNLKSALAETP